MWTALMKEHMEPILSNCHLDETRREQCLSRECPVKGDHGKGIYFHDHRKSVHQTKKMYCANPPPEIWEAYDRVEGGWGTKEDSKIVNAFIAHHGENVNRRDPSKYAYELSPDTPDY